MCTRIMSSHFFTVFVTFLFIKVITFSSLHTYYCSSNLNHFFNVLNLVKGLGKLVLIFDTFHSFIIQLRLNNITSSVELHLNL